MECVRAVLAIQGRSAREVFGTPDDLKLHSSVTLFAEITSEPLFTRVLEHYFSGQPDEITLRLLERLA